MNGSSIGAASRARRRPLVAIFALFAFVLLGAPPLLAAERGRIEGRITGPEGEPIGGVAVAVVGTSTATLTGNDGTFVLYDIPPGTYSVAFTIGLNSSVEENVVLKPGETLALDKQVDWEVAVAEQITVTAASRRAERIVDAPASVTIVSEQEIEREASHGQVPKLLEFTPGAEVTQSGIYDYNFNTRGFNSSLNRRVATLIDGRDPSVPFLGAQEWAAVTFPLDDLAAVELVRGPSAALYGANASAGVLNMTTKQPRLSQGGTARITAGELSTTNVDFRWAESLGNEFYLKFNGGVRYSGDFSRSRNGQAEYSRPCQFTGDTDCLPQEAVALARVEDNDIEFGALRLDKYFSGGERLTFEGGNASIAGPVTQTGIGRVQLIDVQRPWARANFNTDHFNILAYYTSRDAPRQLALQSGSNIALDSERLHLEVQTNWDLAGGRGLFVAGASYRDEEIDTADPDTGRQTLTFAPVSSDSQALFAQFDWNFTERLKGVVAARYDESTLHDAQFSPKGSLVYKLADNHVLRLTYNEAFQVANYSEFFLQADVAPPVNLAPIEGICTAEGVDCGFGSGATRILALGNDDLEVEEVRMIEIGYNAILGSKAYLTLDYYVSENENFITDLVPNIGPGGRINDDFGAYQPPAGLSPTGQATLLGTLQAALGPQFALLSNNVDGTPIFAAVSYTNFGEVDTEGFDVALNYYIGRNWTISAAYSWFDFEIQSEGAAFENQLVPNTPENKASAAISYASRRWDASISGRWSDDFRWVVGPFQGLVESYVTVDLGANYRITESWSVGLNVANAFDSDHWESFGGDRLGRRALANVSYTWQ